MALTPIPVRNAWVADTAPGSLRFKLRMLRRNVGLRARAERLLRAWNNPIDLIPARQTTPLMAAAARGDAATLEQLLEDGAPPDARDARGQTALHHAVRRMRPRAAAILLAYGADHTVTDARGRAPLSLDFTTIEQIHATRQWYRRFHRRRADSDSSISERASELAANLSREGILKLPGLVDAPMLARLRGDMEAFVQTLETRVARGEALYRHYDEEEHFWPKDRAYVTNNAFKYSPTLIDLCCNPLLCQAATEYMGRTAFIQRGVGMRYLPGGRTGNDQFGWHHDMEEKRFKVMVLLTDVNEGDQCMSYALGSHRLMHPYEMFRENFCPPDYVRYHLGEYRLFQATGKAGDLFLFDSNGAHVGNRRESGALRDAFFVEYTTDPSDIWGTDIPQGFFDRHPVQGPNPFARIMKSEKKWNRPTRRKAPQWVEDLPHIDRWR